MKTSLNPRSQIGKGRVDLPDEPRFDDVDDDGSLMILPSFN